MSMLLFLFLATLSGDWPQWAGPERNFAVTDQKISEGWQGEPPLLWKRALGPGYSSLVADQDQLVTLYRDGEQEVVIALNRKDGKTQWEYRYPFRFYSANQKQFHTGPNATPLLMGEQVITVGYSGVLNGLNRHTGKLVWSHDLLGDHAGKQQRFGYSLSPLAYKGQIIVMPGGEKGILALNPKDGSILWQKGPYDISYASPKIISVDGLDLLLFFDADEMVAVKAADGQLQWTHPCKNGYSNNATDPIWDGKELLWIASQMDAGTRVLAINSKGGQSSKQELWSNPKVKYHHWNAVLVQDTVYATIGDSLSLLSGIDFKSGKVLWQERGFAGANLLYCDGKLIMIDGDGDLILARANREGYQALARSPLLGKVARTSPILLDGILFARDQKHILAVDLRPK